MADAWLDDIPVFRPEGGATFTSAVQDALAAIVRAREAGRRELILVTTGLTGFAPPSLAARSAMVRSFADAAQGKLAIAMVVPPDFIDREKFGVVAARNFGLHGEVFTAEDEAAEWLRLHR